MDHTHKMKDGRLLGFAEFGDPKGIPIFYFHGFPGSRLEAGKFHDIAMANHIRLIGIDRPGMGMSTMNKNRSMLDWPADAVEFADALKIDKFSVIGHSGGAPFVAACAFAIPHRLHGAAIVSGMAPFEKPESQMGMSGGQKIVNQTIKNMPWLTSMMMRLTRMMLKNPRMMDKMIHQLPEVDQVLFRDPKIGKDLINSTMEAFRNGIDGPSYEMSLLFTKPWGFDLEKIICPVTIWQGTLDTQAPLSHAKIYANFIPGAELHIVENEEHHSLIKNHIGKIFRNISGEILG